MSNVCCDDDSCEYIELCGYEFVVDPSVVDKCDTMEVETVDVERTNSDTMPATAAVQSNKFHSTKEQLDWLDCNMLTASADSEDNKDDKWDKLTVELNKLGPERVTENWKKIWTSRKCKQKNRAPMQEVLRQLKSRSKVVHCDDASYDAVEAAGNVQQSKSCDEKPSNCAIASERAIEFLPLLLDKLDVLTCEVKRGNELLEKLLNK